MRATAALVSCCALLSVATVTQAVPIRLSTEGSANVGANGLMLTAGSVAQLLTSSGNATLFINEFGTYAQSENTDGVQALANGHVLLSTKASAFIGNPPLAIAKGDIAEYDPVTQAATLFFSGSNFTATVNVDAFHVLPNGHIILSTDVSATLGGLSFKDGDLAEWNPVTRMATLFFSESHFAGDENIDAVSVLPNGHIVLSVSRDTGAALGGITFRDGDVVEYDPVHDTASILLAESDIFAADEDVDAIDIGCGNGFTETDEECDGAGESATCNANCTLAECGDGLINTTAGEQCDDSGESATCDVDCTAVSCGDGTLNVTAGEQCDDGGESATCDADCTTAECGDGTRNAAAGEDCDDAGESATCDANCTVAACGDGTLNVTAGEQCDDGNTADGDCCFASCHFEPAGNTCPADDDPCTNVDRCDGAGACDHIGAPRTGCRAPILPGKAILKVTNKPDTVKDQLQWKWGAGAATTVGDFGSPAASDGASYTLCLYDAAGLLTSLHAPAGGTCGSKACWKPTSKGFIYGDKALTPSGIEKIKLQAGGDGAAKIQLKGRGGLLALRSLPIESFPVTVQLVNDDGVCWDASYPSANRNDAFQFSAKSE